MQPEFTRPDFMDGTSADACIEDLHDNSDVMFDYDSIDAHIRGTLAQFGINPDDYEEEEENGKD